MTNGWIKMHRKLLDNPMAKQPLYCHLWSIMLLLASHKKTEFIFNNKVWVLNPGEFVTGRKALSQKSGISESQVERILKYLKNEHQIECQVTNKFRIITIKNWDLYQSDVLDDTTSTQQIDNRRTTNRQQKDTIKKVKKVKKVKNVKKNEYMEFVYLTDDEHSKLIEQFGEAGLEERIAALNYYIGSKGIKYKSHYHTILSWEHKNDRNNRQTVTSGAGQSGPRPAKPWTDRSFTTPPEEGSYQS